MVPKRPLFEVSALSLPEIKLDFAPWCVIVYRIQVIFWHAIVRRAFYKAEFVTPLFKKGCRALSTTHTELLCFHSARQSCEKTMMHHVISKPTIRGPNTWKAIIGAAGLRCFTTLMIFLKRSPVVKTQILWGSGLLNIDINPSIPHSYGVKQTFPCAREV